MHFRFVFLQNVMHFQLKRRIVLQNAETAHRSIEEHAFSAGFACRCIERHGLFQLKNACRSIERRVRPAENACRSIERHPFSFGSDLHFQLEMHRAICISSWKCMSFYAFPAGFSALRNACNSLERRATVIEYACRSIERHAKTAENACRSHVFSQFYTSFYRPTCNFQLNAEPQGVPDTVDRFVRWQLELILCLLLLYNKK